MVNPNDMTLRIEVGRIETLISTLNVSIVIKGDGRGTVSLYAEDRDEDQSVYLGLDLDAYNKLRRLIRKTDETIKELSCSGKLLALE